MIQIFKPTGDLLATVDVDDKSYRYRAIMGDDSLTLYFSTAEYIEIPSGSFVDFQGVRYILIRPETLKMQHTHCFDYTATFEAVSGLSKIWKFRNTIDGRLKFSLTAKPKEHLQMVVDNLNDRDSAKGWQVGECIESAEKLINYDHNYCSDALSRIASEFGVEYEFKGKTVSLKKLEYNRDAPLPLSYGRGNGFKSGVARTNEGDTPPIKVLFVQGGERNIDASKYGCPTLKLPRSQYIRFDGTHFEDEKGYDGDKARLYITDEKGLSVRREDDGQGARAEGSLDCSEVYPSRVGEVTDVIIENKEKHFYDFVDSSIPSNLDFEKCLIAGEKMTVIFQTGMLAGRELEVKYSHDARVFNGKKKKARRFEIVPQEIDGQTMPNDVFCPQRGDKYAVFHCALPTAYICDNKTRTGAEWEMLRKAVRYLAENENSKFTYTGELDGIWTAKNWENVGGKLVLGGYVRFTDSRFQKEGVLIRITGIKDYINNPHSPEIELNNATVTSGTVAMLKDLKANELQVEESHKAAIQFTKRNFRDAAEMVDTLGKAVQSLSDYTDTISPIAVKTMAMLIGDERLQFRFIDESTKQPDANFAVTYDNAKKVLKVTGSTLQHLTLGIATISNDHTSYNYKSWKIEPFTSSYFDNPKELYYLYAKCEKGGENGTFHLSSTSIPMDGDDFKGTAEKDTYKGHYFFLVGVLNSEQMGERSFASLYGFTEILPGRITADKIASADGSNFFDFNRKAFRVGDAKSCIDWNNEKANSLVLDNATIRNKLNVDGEALVSGFYFSNDKIRSKKTINEKPAIDLDGENGTLTFSSQYDFGSDTFNGKIKIDPFIGTISILTERGGSFDGYTALSSGGVYCDRANQRGFSGTSGRDVRGAVVGFGQGYLEGNIPDEAIPKVYRAVVGVFGRAINEYKEFDDPILGNKYKHEPAPAYGGYFCELMAEGLNLSVELVKDGTDNKPLEASVSQVIGINKEVASVILPQGGHYIGKVIYVKSLFNTVVVRPPEGACIWTKEKRTEYYVNAGEEARFVYLHLNDEAKYWVCSCYSFT